MKEQMDAIKEAAKQDFQERREIYNQVLENPTLDSLAEHIVNLYDADVQAMRQEIISSGMFKTILDIMIEKDLTTSEEVDTKLAENIKAIEEAYNEQYAKFQEYIDSMK